jgi:hypothetical protein
VIGTVVPSIILLAFIGYLVRPLPRTEAGKIQPPEWSTVAPGKLAQLPSPNSAVPPKGNPPAPAPIPFVKVNLVAVKLKPIEADPAPPPANPDMPLIDEGVENNEQTVDLRGPAPQIGFKVREVCRIEGQRTDKLTNSRGQAVTLTGYMRGDIENLYTVEEVENDAVTKYQTKVIKGESTFSYLDPSGGKRTVDHIDDLAGEVIVSEKLPNMWSHTLLKSEPSLEQQKELIRWRSPFDDREQIPAGRHKPGTSWELDAIEIKKLLGIGVNAVSGKMKATFDRLEPYRGDECVVIEYKGTIRARSEPDEVLQERIETCYLELATHRSLRYGIGVKTSGVIITKSAGKVKIDGQNADFAGRGRTTVTYLAKVEK